MRATNIQARIILCFLASMLLTGNVRSEALQGSEWQPVHIGSLAVPRESPAFVQFRSKGRLAGFGGCNQLWAEYQLDAGHIFVGPISATRMACADSVMALEAALVSALENARTFQRMQTRLVLFDSGARPLLEMRQTDWD